MPADHHTPAVVPAADPARAPRSTRRHVAVALVALSLLGQACVRTTAEAPLPSATTDPTAGSPVPARLALDWLDRPASVDLGGGWTIGACEGDAPLLCVQEGGADVGVVELLAFPAAPGRYPDEPATDEQLHAEAEEFLRVMREDRGTTCADHEFVADAVVTTTVGGGPGVRYGFELRSPTGRVVEKVIGHLAIREHGLVVLAANALAPDGCMVDPEFAGFEPDALARFAPRLGAVAAGSILPTFEQLQGR